MILSCRNVGKIYRAQGSGSFHALRDVSIDVGKGVFMAIVGPSGSGKSTLLRILAGLERASEGVVSIEDATAVRAVGFVFQNDAVFPWRSVKRNLSYSLEARGASRVERERRVEELAEIVGLPREFLDKYPRELSGGEIRRLALGMALSTNSEILFLDEPTSQLDFVSRLKLQAGIQDLWLKTRPTVLHVTHDVDEAVFLAQQVMVMRAGQVQDLFEVALPFPRNQNLLQSSEAATARSRIMHCIGL